ncbi:vomeronasal type-1 receptor 90-like [Cynocephalus volans]|uniref:vomeronasal type-1 receptor 90-like n=1 Tax=Cynocephalus volans TaxID=110931 RepID=UPI002FC5A212
MNINNKFYTFIAIRNAFFCQLGIGILANALLLVFHVLTFLLEHRPKATDLTIGHLALIHLVMLLTVGIMATDIFGSQNFWDDIECKAVLYLYRLMRGLSICTTCLLSVLQAITLSPRSSCLAKFKHKCSHHNPCVFLFLWVFNMSVSGRFIISTISTPNVTSGYLMYVTESCSLWPLSYLFRYVFSTLVTFRDISFVGLMALSSGYMVVLLNRHKRQFQHLRSTILSPKASPGKRATRTILLLMSFFVVMYCLDCVVSSSSGMLWNNDPVRLCVQMLVGNGYAAISPLVLISTEKRIIKFLTSMWMLRRKVSVNSFSGE